MGTNGKIERGGDRRRENMEPPAEFERRHAVADRRLKNNRQLVTFYLEDHFFGIAVEKVQEAFSSKAMTSVPMAPPTIAGLINLRGQIIMTIDLRIRLGFQSRPSGDASMSIVVRTAEGPVNLLVDKIGDVMLVHPDLFETPPKTLEKQMSETIDGVYKLEDRLLLALNTELATQVI
ncbi:MAG: chemotaxis protein CheW [Nitrospiria bacterium]